MASDPVRWRRPLPLSAFSGVVHYRYRYRSDVRVVREKTLDGGLVPPGALHSFLDGRAGDTDTGHVVAGNAVLDTGWRRSIWQIRQLGGKFGLDSWSKMDCDLQVVGTIQTIVCQLKIRPNMDGQPSVATGAAPQRRSILVRS